MLNSQQLTLQYIFFARIWLEINPKIDLFKATGSIDKKIIHTFEKLLTHNEINKAFVEKTIIDLSLDDFASDIGSQLKNHFTNKLFFSTKVQRIDDNAPFALCFSYIQAYLYHSTSHGQALAELKTLEKKAQYLEEHQDLIIQQTLLFLIKTLIDEGNRLEAQLIHEYLYLARTQQACLPESGYPITASLLGLSFFAHLNCKYKTDKVINMELIHEPTLVINRKMSIENSEAASMNSFAYQFVFSVVLSAPCFTQPFDPETYANMTLPHLQPNMIFSMLSELQSLKDQKALLEISFCKSLAHNTNSPPVERKIKRADSVPSKLAKKHPGFLAPKSKAPSESETKNESPKSLKKKH